MACHNGPCSFVLAGDTLSMARVEEECKDYKMTRLQNTHAYHSYLTESILDKLGDVAESLDIRPPRIHVETCSADGNWSQFTAREVVQHTKQPVYFADAVKRIISRVGSAIWLEAGSMSPIINLVRRNVGKPDDSGRFVPTDLGSPLAIKNLTDATCQMWRMGCSVQYWLFHRSSNQRYQQINLPPYQFEQVRHWTDYKPRSKEPSSAQIHDMVIKEPNLVEQVKEDIGKGEHLFLVDTSYPIFELGCRGHAVVGQSLCPASMYIEIATRSVLSLPETESLNATPPHIEGLTMSAPLGLDDAATVFVRLGKAGANQWSFSVFSQQARGKTSSEDTTEHAKGQINLIPARNGFIESRLSLLQRFVGNSRAGRILEMPSATGISGPIVYELFSEVVDYADYYRGVQSVSALEHEAVAHVVLPRDPTWGMASVVCDPIPLDNFLQVAGVHVNRLSPRKKDVVFMCTAVGEIILSETFIADKSDLRTWLVYSQYDRSSRMDVANNILVYDATSKDLVVAIMGARFHSVPLKALARTLSRSNTGAATPTDVSDTSSQTLDDSGYQTWAHTPDSNENPKGANTHVTFNSKVLDGQLQKQSQSPRQVESQGNKGGMVQPICEMFSEILEIPIKDIQPTAKLDDLGIDSLLATEVLTEISKRFKVKLTAANIQECDDVLSVCKCIEASKFSESSIPKAQTAAVSANVLEDGILNHPSSPPLKDDRVSQELSTVSRQCFLQERASYNRYADDTGFANFYDDVYPLQSELVEKYVIEAFKILDCDLNLMKLGEKLCLTECDPKHGKLIWQLFKILEDGGFVEKKGQNGFFRTTKPVPLMTTGVLYGVMVDKFPKHSSETKLLHSTASQLADCLTGAVDPLALMFGDAGARALMEDVYTNAPMFRTGTLLLAQYLTSVLKNFVHDREIRILELGAGTGGTTKYLVEQLANLGSEHKFSYTFTDLSPSLVAAARRKFAKWSFMEYKVLDVEQEPGADLSQAYDIIISINCIHATKDLVSSLANIRKMLRLNGIIGLVELTRNLFWFDLVFGLLEGWWLFKDGREHALADEWRWKQALHAAGFQWIEWSGDETKESDVLRVITASPCRVVDSLENATTTKGDQDDKSLQGCETVVFKQVNGLNLHADIYYPDGPVDSAVAMPIAIMIHGGGHVMLSRNDIRPDQTQLLLRKGFLPVSIDYRLCPETTLTEGPMTDVADALVWVRNTLPTISLTRQDIRVDAKNVVAVGWSTGGHLAMSLAWQSLLKHVQPPQAILAFYCPTDYEDSFWTAPNIPSGSRSMANATSSLSEDFALDEDVWAGVFEQPVTSYNVPPQRRALGGWLSRTDPRSRLALHMNWHGQTLHVLLYGLDKQRQKTPPAPSASEVAKISPLAHIRSGSYTTPTFVIHPREDDLIPWQQSLRTVEALHERNVDAEVRIVEGVPHLFDVYPEHQMNEAAMKAVAQGYDFLERLDPSSHPSCTDCNPRRATACRPPIAASFTVDQDSNPPNTRPHSQVACKTCEEADTSRYAADMNKASEAVTSPLRAAKEPIDERLPGSNVQNGLVKYRKGAISAPPPPTFLVDRIDDMTRVRRSWTAEEDALLRRVVTRALVQSRPLLWRELAKSVPGRSNKDCRRRWWNTLAEGTAKGSWSEDEDAKLIEAVTKHGTNWAQVARAVASRNSDQCSSHWTQVLDPNINYCEWTPEEDDHLLHAVLSHGTNWTTIAASHGTRRTTLALKNRYSTLRMRHEHGHRSKRNSAENSSTGALATPKDTPVHFNTGMLRSQKSQDKKGYGSEDDEEDDEDDEDEDGDVDEGEDPTSSQIRESRDEGMTAGDQLSKTVPKPVEMMPYVQQRQSGFTPHLNHWPGMPNQDGLLTPKSFAPGNSPAEAWTPRAQDFRPYQSPYPINPSSFSPTPLGGGFLMDMPNAAGNGLNVPYEAYGELSLMVDSARNTYASLTIASWRCDEHGKHSAIQWPPATHSSEDSIPEP
ncbi:MAG: hypothetical protein Q9219_001699 [cf. Caloplaca sp. 3 TL-2023]